MDRNPYGWILIVTVSLTPRVQSHPAHLEQSSWHSWCNLSLIRSIRDRHKRGVGHEGRTYLRLRDAKQWKQQNLRRVWNGTVSSLESALLSIWSIHLPDALSHSDVLADTGLCTENCTCVPDSGHTCNLSDAPNPMDTLQSENKCLFTNAEAYSASVYTSCSKFRAWYP